MFFLRQLFIFLFSLCLNVTVSNTLDAGGQKYSTNSSNVKPKYFLGSVDISKETPNTFNRFD